ncbi:hypothetical protein TNCT_580311 [Trichonephila clavata]|uniref:Uncharacterized protein n=1 Tax=Trichonephila clavata TaxID=2740835 RepID=A0A8X6IWK2_TRICU|nr:hypothetical protein TNCT_580311 [Trichonephila clavata]
MRFNVTSASWSEALLPWLCSAMFRKWSFSALSMRVLWRAGCSKGCCIDHVCSSYTRGLIYLLAPHLNISAYANGFSNCETTC